MVRMMNLESLGILSLSFQLSVPDSYLLRLCPVDQDSAFTLISYTFFESLTNPQSCNYRTSCSPLS